MIKMTIAKLKSNTLASKVDKISISLGKYIFLISEALFVNALIAEEIELAKNNQGSKPA